MRPKRQKPRSQKPGSQQPGSQKSGSPESGSPEPGFSKSGRQKARSGFSSHRSTGRPFERQVDADLTDSEPAADAEAISDLSSTEFSGADFPEIDPQAEPADSPVINLADVRERAVRLLVNREHGRHELEQKLLQRELPSDLIDSVLDQLAEEGLQCDARFAESYTRMRVDRGYGANKVRADLQARRLAQSVIENAIADSGADWNGVAGSALAKKFGGNSVVDMKTRAKMQRYLYQRGFSQEDIRSALDDYEAVDSEN